MSARGAAAELRDRRRLSLIVSLLLNLAFLLTLHFGTTPHGRVDMWHPGFAPTAPIEELQHVRADAAQRIREGSAREVNCAFSGIASFITALT